MMVLGTSSTQVWPGCSGMGTPNALTNCVGDPRVDAVPGGLDGHPVAVDRRRCRGVGVQVRLHLQAALGVLEPRARS